MSEASTPPSTPERERIAPPDIEGAPSHLQPAQIEAMRRNQLIELNDTLKGYALSGERFTDDEEHALCEGIVDRTLSDAGVAKGTTEYDAQRALLLEASVDSILEKDWYNSQTVDGETKPPRRDDIFGRVERIVRPVEADDETADDDTEREPTEVTPEQRERLNELSKKKQEAYVKLIKMPFYRPGARKEAKEEYATALREYTEAIREISLGHISARLEAGDDKNTIFQRVADLFSQDMQSDANSEHALFLSRGGKRGKLLEWYSKQSTWKKIGVGVGAGMFMAGGGFAAGAFGLVPAAAAVVGGGLMTGRATKTYLASLSRLYKDTPDNVAKMDFTNPGALDADQAADLVRDYIIRESNDRVRSAEKTRRVAVGWAMGSLVIGATLATVGAVTQTGEGQGFKPFRNPVDTQFSTRGLFNGDSTGDDIAPPKGGTPLPLAPDAHSSIDTYIDAHDAGVEIDKGEGWYKTFKDFGVPGQYRDDLLKELGPQLEKMGEAYKTPDGLWGISRPGDLSDEASRLIVEKASEHGWVDIGTIADAAKDVTEIPEALSDVKPGEGILQSLRDAGLENPTLDDVTAVQDQLVENGVAYADGPGGYAGLNLPDHGQMSSEGVNTLMDYADNKQLDNSTGLTDIVGKGSDAVDPRDLSGLVDAKDHLSYLEATELKTDVHQISDLLNAKDTATLNANIATLNENADYQDALQYIQQDIKGLTYPGTDVPIIESSNTVGGRSWVLNGVPEGSHVPTKVLNTLVAYEQAQFALAA